MDFHIKVFTKTPKLLIIGIILFSYLIVNGLLSWIGGYHYDFFKDYGNLINYTFLVPGMFFFLHYSYIFLTKTINLPIDEKIIKEENLYKKVSYKILNQKWYSTLILVLISIALQLINHYGIENDGKPKTIWLEGLDHSLIWFINYTYYTFLNAFLMYCLLDASFRWVKVSILLWRMYYRKSFGELSIDNRYLIPSDYNPSFTIGKFLFYLSIVAIFVSINFATTTKINFGVTPDSEFIKTAISSFYWILSLPVIIFFIPAFPIKRVHKKYLNEITLIEYNNLIIKSEEIGTNNNLLQYIENIGRLKKLTIWPIKISIIQTIYTIYFIPIIIEIIKAIIISQ